MQNNFDAIIESVRKKYRNFDSPDYSFVDINLPKQCAIYKELFDNYAVVEDTDFNCEVCMHYYVTDSLTNWEICVSLVGPYAMISREIDRDIWKVISRNNEITPSDGSLITLLEKYGYNALSETQLKAKVSDFVLMNDCDIHQEDVYLYKVLFFFDNLRLLSDR